MPLKKRKSNTVKSKKRRTPINNLQRVAKKVIVNKKTWTRTLLMLPTMILVTFIVGLMSSKLLRDKIAQNLLRGVTDNAITELDQFKVWLASTIVSSGYVLKQDPSTSITIHPKLQESIKNKNMLYYIQRVSPIVIIKKLYMYLNTKLSGGAVTKKEVPLLSKEIASIFNPDMLSSIVTKSGNTAIGAGCKSIHENQVEIQKCVRETVKNSAIATAQGLGDAAKYGYSMLPSVDDVAKYGYSISPFLDDVPYSSTDIMPGTFPQSNTSSPLRTRSSSRTGSASFKSARSSITLGSPNSPGSINTEELSKLMSKVESTGRLSLVEVFTVSPKMINF